GQTRRLRLVLQARPRPRPRGRPRHPRGAAALPRVDRHARGRQRRHDRARDLPRGPGRHPDRRPRDRDRRRPGDPHHVHQGPGRGRLAFRAVAETVSTNQFRNGMHIQLEGSVWRIIGFQHVKPGKGGACVSSRLRNVDSGAVVDKTFRAGEKFPRIRTEVKEVQYLYDAGDETVFMDTDTYEQFSLPHSTVEDALPYLEPSSTVQMLEV